MADDELHEIAKVPSATYYHRAKMNAAARTGSYAPEVEREAVAA
jgi:hypothetical protein